MNNEAVNCANEEMGDLANNKEILIETYGICEKEIGIDESMIQESEGGKIVDDDEKREISEGNLVDDITSGSNRLEKVMRQDIEENDDIEMSDKVSHSVLNKVKEEEFPFTDERKDEDTITMDREEKETEILDRKDEDASLCEEDDSEQSEFSFQSSSEEESDVDGKELADDFEDDIEEVESSELPIKSQNEVKKLPIVEPLHMEITPEMVLNEVGRVYSVVDDLVIVECELSNDARVLDTDSILVFDNRAILGRVFDTFGPVVKPMYSIRFNSSAEIDAAVVFKGRKVYCLPDLAKYVFTQALKQHKGTDASNVYDEEVNEDEVEFSDDEKEAEYRLRMKLKRSGKTFEDGEVVESKSKKNATFPQRSLHSTHSQQSSHSSKQKNYPPNHHSRNSQPPHYQQSSQSHHYQQSSQPSHYQSSQPSFNQTVYNPAFQPFNPYYSTPSTAYPAFQQGYIPFTNQIMYQPMAYPMATAYNPIMYAQTPSQNPSPAPQSFESSAYSYANLK